jgi:hypothetical protein
MLAFTVIDRAAVVSEQLPDVTNLRYHVFCDNTPGEYPCVFVDEIALKPEVPSVIDTNQLYVYVPVPPVGIDPLSGAGTVLINMD